MSQIPEQLHYRESHEWVDLTQNPAPVGITDHAQAELTDVVFVELPKVGAVVRAGQQVCVVESVKAASDIYSPVSGEIVEVNEALGSDPGLINRDPYAAGHIFKIKPSDASEAAGLKDAAAYKAHLG
jgi:glycine cleavage system H protein